LQALLAPPVRRVDTPDCSFDDWCPVLGDEFRKKVKAERKEAWQRAGIRALRRQLMERVSMDGGRYVREVPGAPWLIRTSGAGSAQSSNQAGTGASNAMDVDEESNASEAEPEPAVPDRDKVLALTHSQLVETLAVCDDAFHEMCGFVSYLQYIGRLEDWVAHNEDDPWTRNILDQTEDLGDDPSFTGFEKLRPIEPKEYSEFVREQRREQASRCEVSLAGCELQVIVKLASIELTPEKPKYSGGTWHVEGMADEAIVATAIYYVASENVTASRLDFRCAVSEYFPYEQNELESPFIYYGIKSDHDETGQGRHMQHQSLGYCSTPAGRALAWPNTYQHRVAPFELEDPTRPGHREILVYFLVDPYRRVRSTSTVRPQQREWWARELRRMPLFEWLSDEILMHVLSFVPGLMTFEQAVERRARLMRERKFIETKANRQVFERPFSLCEH
jgi:hypothetical protein